MPVCAGGANAAKQDNSAMNDKINRRSWFVSASEHYIKQALASLEGLKYPSQWRTREQMAEWLRVSVRSIDYWTDERILPRLKKGGIVRYDLKDCWESLKNRFTGINFQPPEPILPSPAPDASGKADLWATRDDLAAWLQVSTRTIEHWTDDGSLPRLKLGAVSRYDPKVCRAALNAYISGGNPTPPELPDCRDLDMDL